MMAGDERHGSQGCPRILIIGVGNEYRRDDGVGPVVARWLKEKGLPNTTIIEETGEGAALMERWKGADVVILLDAASSGAEPGTVHRFEAQARSIPTMSFRSSTHAFGLAEAVELARTFNQLPPRLIVYGIEGKRFEAGIGLSPEVERAAREVAEHVIRDVPLTPAHDGCQVPGSRVGEEKR